ncbi:MAG TPA: hypothetical protein VNS58_18390 [Puia sp.]|nr:hypothetical protein [Puia sp.]
MKKIIPLVSILTVMTIFLCITHSCKKSSSSSSTNNNGLATQATAQASYDNQSGGVYKGELTGSSGYFEVNLQASRPFIIYQWTNPAGNIDSLFTTSLNNWASGQAISKAVFTGSDGSVIWFSVSANGSNPSLDSIYIPSHSGPVYASVEKELSNSLVKVYLGIGTPVSSNGGSCVSATVNFWTSGGTAAGTYLATSGDHGGGTGTLSGNQIQITMGKETGTLTLSSDGNTISGTVNGSGSNSCSHTIALTRVF